MQTIVKKGSVRSNFDLAISMTGSVVTVPAGTVVSEGVTYTILEDQTYDAPTFTKNTAVYGYIAEDTSTNEVLLVVDEADDGELFNFRGSNYKRLQLAFTLKALANVAPTDVHLTVRNRPIPPEV